MQASPVPHVKTYVLILFIIIFSPLGNVFLGKGMKHIGSAKDWSAAELAPIALRVLSSGYIWLGIAFLLAFFVSHMLILTWADFSYVQPSCALAYATVAVLSYFFLGEHLSALRWSGIVLISAGVFIVSSTPHNTTRVQPHA